MKISTKGRYALRFMVDLAQNAPDAKRNIALNEISARQDISVKYLEQIVTKLCKEGLLSSCRGPQGGYRLIKRPEEYSIGEILFAIEGKMAPIACLDENKIACPRKDRCAAIKFWSGLDNVINDYINSVSLGEIANEPENCPIKSENCLKSDQ